MEPENLLADLRPLHEAGYQWALNCSQWQPQEAEEILQTVYLKILSRKASFKRKSSLKTWFFGVIRITAKEHYRHQLLGKIRLTNWQKQQEHDHNENGHNAASERKIQSNKQFIEAMQHLPDKQKQVISLMLYHDLSIEESARIMSVTLGTARVHYQRAKAKLREQLQ